MTTMINRLPIRRRYKIDERGVTAIEYGLIAAMIAVGIIAAVSSAGASVKQTFCVVAGAIGGSPSGCGGSSGSTTPVVPASFAGWAPMPSGTTCTSISPPSFGSNPNSFVYVTSCGSGGSYSNTMVSIAQQTSSSGVLQVQAMGAGGQQILIASPLNVQTGATPYSVQTTPYANPNGTGTCTNQSIGSLNSTQRAALGFSKVSASNPLMTAVVPICTG